MHNEADRHDRRYQGRSVVVNGAYLTRPSFGIHRVVAAIVSFLIREGADVTLLVPEPLSLERFGWTDLAVEVREGPRFGAAVTWEQLTVASYLRTSSAEVYLAPGSRGIPVRSVPQRTVLMVHDLIPFRYWKTTIRHSPIPTVVQTSSMYTSIKAADALIGISQCTVDEMRELLGVIAIPAYPPLSDIPIVKGARLEPEPYFAFTGGVDPRKNFLASLEGFAIFRKDHPEFTMRVTGGFTHEYFAPRIAELGLTDAINFTGHLDAATLEQTVAASTAVLYPSSWEGRGLPILESLALGVPVVCGAAGSQKEMAGDVGICVDPITPATLAAAMSEVISLEESTDFTTQARRQFDIVDDPMWSANLLATLWPERS